MTLAELCQAWTQRRDEWRRLGCLVDGAKLAEEILADLARLEATDTVSLAEAAEITGRTADHIGRLARLDQLPNVGRKHAPRIPRAALERLGRRSKASGPELPTPAGDAYNPTADARSLLRRRAQGESHGP
jgi:hypothetical protein